MLKYDYKKIIAKTQEKHINIKDLIEHSEIYMRIDNVNAVRKRIKNFEIL